MPDLLFKASYPRSHRLVKQRDFQFVFAKPLKVKRRDVLMLYRPNEQAIARLGMIISKHHVRRAVDRNLLKRLIRESFRQLTASLKGFDIVVLMRSKWRPLGKQAWRDEIDNLWQPLINS